jgi:hypothetical protein
MARTKFGAAVKWGVIGAAATWLFDPERGADRRRQLQDKVMGVARERKDELTQRFSGPSPANGNGNGASTRAGSAETIQLEPDAPGGPSVAPPTA